MNVPPIDLRAFARRVRLVRAWRGLAIGLAVGGTAALAWSVLDVLGVAFTEWSLLGVLTATTAIVGIAIGLIIPVRQTDVARSVDRRADLRDRIGTAMERAGDDETFDAALQQDARSKTADLRASQLYPVRVGRWQYLALCTLALASTVFLLGNAWPLLSPEARATKEELKKISQDIERVAKPIIERKDATDAEKAFANDLQDFAKRLEKGRIDKESAMQRANELAQQAEKLTDKRVDKSMKSVRTAREQMARSELAENGLDQKALDSLKNDAQRNELLNRLKAKTGQPRKNGDNKFSQAMLDEMGLQDLDPSLLNMSDEMRESIEKHLNERLKEIEEALKNAQNLTPDQLRSLQDEQAELEGLQQALKISEEARKILEEFMNSPEYQDIMKEVAELRKAANQVSKGQPLSPEQIKELEQGLEELAEKLKDSKYRDQVMKALKEALEQLKAGHATCEAGGT